MGAANKTVIRLIPTALTVILFLQGQTCLAQAELGLAPIRDPQRLVHRHVHSWLEIQRQCVVMQQRDFSCGAAALATVLQYYWGDPIGEQMILNEIEAMLPSYELADRIANGLSMADLRKAAVRMGYVASVGRVDLQQLSEVKVPVIVAINYRGYDHFVVVRGIVDGWVYLADPIRGNVRVPCYIFYNQWIDDALLVVLQRGQTTSPYSQLDVTVEEAELGWLNGQVVRRHPERVFSAIRPY